MSVPYVDCVECICPLCWESRKRRKGVQKRKKLTASFSLLGEVGGIYKGKWGEMQHTARAIPTVYIVLYESFAIVLSVLCGHLILILL